MAYHINEIKVVDFIGDTTIKLPRFQRRQAWDLKKDFGLCVSMFKGYPLGVVIYNHTKEGGRDVNYLLDGRQRRNALKRLIEDPGALYDAALRYLGVKVSSTEQELCDVFWMKVGAYLNQPTDREIDDVDGEDSDIDVETQRGNLKTLLSLLKSLHGSMKKGVTALETRWNFSSYFTYLPYVKNGKIDVRKLKDFIVRTLAERFSDETAFDSQSFFDFMIEEFGIAVGRDAAFRDKLEAEIESLINDFRVLCQAQTTVFDQAYLGVIKIMKVTSLDSQNIFSLVNKGGTPLKAEELLSAKPFWNKEIPALELPVDVRNSIVELYRGLRIPGENDQHNGSFVYWDLCATFVDRIDKEHLLFPLYCDDETGLLLKIQHGFKAVAAMLKDGVSAVRIEEIEKDPELNFVEVVPELQCEVNRIIALLLSNGFFKRFLGWGRPMSELIGIAPTLEFLAVMHKLWLQWGCGSGDNEKKFINSAISLFDRLILEHASGGWKGSGDSKMARHLRGNLEDRVAFLPKDDWEKFVVNSCAPADEDYSKKKGVLYYFATLQGMMPDNPVEMEYDIDHIIPQEDFRQLVSGINVDVGLMNCLGNIALLPKKKNESKGKKKLNELGDELRQVVSKFIGVPVSDFARFSSVLNIGDLVETRKRLFLGLVTKRESMMSR